MKPFKNSEVSRARPLVVVIATGGTIAMKSDPQTGAAVPALSGQDLAASVPALAETARIEVVSVCNIDSFRMSPDIWLELAKTAQAAADRPDVAGVVITHGTDTMADTAYFLDLTIQTGKPLILTGAMRNASSPDWDGPANLHSAVREASSSDALNRGVTVMLNNCIQPAACAEKLSSVDLQAFGPAGGGVAGAVRRGNGAQSSRSGPGRRLRIPERLARVPLLATYVGDDGSLIRQAAALGAEGVVVNAFGAGNLNQFAANAVADVVELGIPVVIASMCREGGAHPEYGSEGGGADLARRGAILSRALRGEKARILLSVLLGLNTPRKDLAGFF